MRDSMASETVVIGAGAAGMIAAGRLRERGCGVTLIERNSVAGRKIRITGKGRCNITNACETEDIIKNVTANAKFLYSAVYTFTNEATIALMERLGVPVKVERGGRVFPVSDSAKDVAEALKRYSVGCGARIVHGRAEEVLLSEGRVFGVRLEDGRTVKAGSVIIATGGKSYPLTGSTGDGYKMAEKCGHTVIAPRPSLVPLVTEEKWCAELMGLSLKNISVTVRDAHGKKIYTDFGELLFTHFGLSGPVILSASAHMKKPEGCKVSIDLKPALSPEKLDARILRDFEKHSRKHLVNGMEELLPKALIPVVLRLSGLDGHRTANSVTRAERLRLGEVIKSLELTVKRFRPIDEAIVTSGGVKVSEIDPSTMESKIVPGLYFAGEVIDVDAYTGGFNLQIAFSTGYLAAESIADSAEHKE